MKAIYIIDMPDCCYDCPITVCDADTMSASCRSGDCPLRELPEQMQVCGKYPQLGNPVPSYRIGWNDCLKKIVGNNVCMDDRLDN